MSLRGWRAFANVLRFQPWQDQLREIGLVFDKDGDAWQLRKDRALVKKAVPMLLSANLRPLLNFTCVYGDAATARGC